MPVDQYDTSFNSLSPPEFILTLNNFADSLLAHEFFKNNWPEWLTHPTALKDKLAFYNEAVKACEADGGRKNMQDRDERRQDAHASATFMGQYVVMRSVSEQMPKLLKEVSLKLRSRSTKVNLKSFGPLGIPENLSVKHAIKSAAIVIAFSRVKYAGSFEIQVCEGDPAVEANWRTVGQYRTCRVELKGYAPGTKLYVRVRCHGTGEPGPYTQPVSIIVI